MQFKIFKNKEKTKENAILKSQKRQEKSRGRSMVEMLGVLAIIGVLSIGGISGYTIAMRKHRANEIANLMMKYISLEYINFVNYRNQDSENVRIEEGIYPEYGCKERGYQSYYHCSFLRFADTGLGALPSGVTEMRLVTFLAPTDAAGTTKYYTDQSMEPGTYAEMEMHFVDTELCQTVSNLFLGYKGSDAEDGEHCKEKWFAKPIPVLE